jgi:hypothetical protein
MPTLPPGKNFWELNTVEVRKQRATGDLPQVTYLRRLIERKVDALMIEVETKKGRLQDNTSKCPCWLLQQGAA